MSGNNGRKKDPRFDRYDNSTERERQLLQELGYDPLKSCNNCRVIFPDGIAPICIDGRLFCSQECASDEMNHS